MNFDKLKNLMDDLVETNHAPGNTIVVYSGNEQVFNYSCGYSDFEKKIPMTGDEYFNFYSCSKVATVTAALQLLEKGKFLLNDPLYEYIPEYKDMYIKTADGELVKAKEHITIKNLFNMTAGLTYRTNTDAFKKAHELTNGKMDTDVVIRCIAKDPLMFEPGENFNYSLCHDVLAGLICVISGKKFIEYMKENIFQPLGMNSCTYRLTDEIKANMATQYMFTEEDDSEFDLVEAQMSGKSKGGKFVDVGCGNQLVFGEEYESGGAGIIAKVSDYVKLAQALANDGVGLTGERILSPYTINLMKTNTLNDKQLKTFSQNNHIGYGYGLGVRTLIDKAKSGTIANIGEFGWGGAAGASVYIDNTIGLAAVYAKHTLNPREEYYQPRVRNALYAGLDG